MLEYKGYRGSYSFDHPMKVAYGEVRLRRGVIAFSGTSIQELQADMERAVETYLHACRRAGIEPSPPGDRSTEVPS